MKKTDKGLADDQQAEFVLNESGTSVSTDPVEGMDTPASTPISSANNKKETEKSSSISDSQQKNSTV